jgi:hypothetical protein
VTLTSTYLFLKRIALLGPEAVIMNELEKFDDVLAGAGRF